MFQIGTVDVFNFFLPSQTMALN